MLQAVQRMLKNSEKIEKQSFEKVQQENVPSIIISQFIGKEGKRLKEFLEQLQTPVVV